MSRFIRSFAKRKKFLDQIAEGDSPRMAAMKAGAELHHFKAWRKSDENFARDWDEAYEEGTQALEDVATERAIEKSDPLMMFILKSRDPGKYDRGGKLELSGKINVEGSKAKLLNKIAKLQALQNQGNQEGSEEGQEAEAEEVKLLPAPGEQFAPRPAIVRGSKRSEKIAKRGRATP